MEVIVNGTSRLFDGPTTIADLLQGLELARVRVAVEINEDLVPRKLFDQTIVEEGDRIEIVAFVGGG